MGDDGTAIRRICDHAECAAEAKVGINGRWVCMEHMDAAMKQATAPLRKLRAALAGKGENDGPVD